jgi:protoheme IX farnesyltransferase
MSSDTHIITDEPVALAGAGLSLAGPRDFFQLMKPRVMSLVIFTAIIGLLVAPGTLPLYNSVMAILCIAVGAGASGALNMWYDADIDAQMTRTKKRPLPRGVMAPGTALTFGFLLSVVSVWMLALATNYVAAGLLAFTIFFYVVIYTMWLKRRTPQNIVIGGAPGALPPMIGYAAVTGSVTWDSTILFLIIFIWTPPHFWALALYKLSDYGRVGIPMMPNVAGPKSTRNQIFGYSVVLAAVSAAPVITGLGGSVYAFGAFLLNVGFLALAFKVWKSRAGEKDEVQPESLYEVQKGDRDARNLFAYSIIYLFAMFALIGVDYLLIGAAS